MERRARFREVMVNRPRRVILTEVVREAPPPKPSVLVSWLHAFAGLLGFTAVSSLFSWMCHR